MEKENINHYENQYNRIINTRTVKSSDPSTDNYLNYLSLQRLFEELIEELKE